MADDQPDHQREDAAVDELLTAVRARLESLIRDGASVSALGAPDAVAADIVARLGLVKNPWAGIVGPCFTSGGLQKELGVGAPPCRKPFANAVFSVSTPLTAARCTPPSKLGAAH